MTMNYFTPNDLHIIEGTFNYKARSGIGFAITPDNERMFITAKDVDAFQLNIGDSIRGYVVDNYAKAETSHFPSRWRAVRLEVVQRVEDFPAYVAPSAKRQHRAASTDFVGVMDFLLQEPRMWTPNELTHAIVRHTSALSTTPELLQKVSGRLAMSHQNGEVACAKVYAKRDQDRASAVYYARDVDVIYEHLDTPLNEDE
jgi:hypothetical protein